MYKSKLHKKKKQNAKTKYNARVISIIILITNNYIKTKKWFLEIKIYRGAESTVNYRTKC